MRAAEDVVESPAAGHRQHVAAPARPPNEHEEGQVIEGVELVAGQLVRTARRPWPRGDAGRAGRRRSTPPCTRPSSRSRPTSTRRARSSGPGARLPAARQAAAPGQGDRRRPADGEPGGHGRLLPDPWVSPGTPRRTRSRRRSASSRASTTRTRTPATRRPKRSSRRSTRPTRRSRTRRSAASTTSCCRLGAFGPAHRPARPGTVAGGQGFDPRIFQQWQQQGGGQGFDMGDLLSSLFGGGRAAASAARRKQAAERGADLQVGVTLSFEDSLNGVTVRVPVDKPDTCGTCHGSGAAARARRPRSARNARAAASMAQNQGCFALSQPCPRCGGNGTIIEHAVPARAAAPACCAADAALHREGARRRQGRHARSASRDAVRPALRGGPAGDLYVVVHVRESTICSSAAATICCSRCR